MLFLLRHGEPEGGSRFWGQQDVKLNTRGRQQMEEAIKPYLDRPPWDRVVTSPLRRCAEFACQFADRMDLPLHYDARIQEMDFGDWSGLSAADVHERDAEALGRFWQDPVNSGAPGGETYEDFAQRVTQALNEEGDVSSLWVTHGGVFRVVMTARERISITEALGRDVPHAAMLSYP